MDLFFSGVFKRIDQQILDLTKACALNPIVSKSAFIIQELEFIRKEIEVIRRMICCAMEGNNDPTIGEPDLVTRCFASIYGFIEARVIMLTGLPDNVSMLATRIEEELRDLQHNLSLIFLAEIKLRAKMREADEVVVEDPDTGKKKDLQPLPNEIFDKSDTDKSNKKDQIHLDTKNNYFEEFFMESDSHEGEENYGLHLPTRETDFKNIAESGKAAIHTLAVIGAKKSFIWANSDVQSSETVFSANNFTQDAIAIYLRKERVEFDVNIHLESGVEAGTLLLLRKSVVILVEGRVLFDEPFYKIVLVKENNDSPRFRLEFSCGSTCICSPSVSLHGRLGDEILVTLKAFQLKAYMIAETYPAWPRPTKGAVKLSVDATYDSEKDSAAIGGLIRDEAGKWLRGFWGQVELAERTELVLLAVKKGLSLAVELRKDRQLDERFIEVETTCDFVYYLLKRGTDEPLLCDVVADCRKLIGMLMNCRVVRVELEVNRAALLVADEGHNMGPEEKGLKILDAAPAHLEELNDVLLMDMTGIMLPVATRMSEIKKMIEAKSTIVIDLPSEIKKQIDEAELLVFQDEGKTEQFSDRPQWRRQI